jgi:hypothetical protein
MVSITGLEGQSGVYQSAPRPKWLGEMGPAPDEYIQTFNPAYEKWIERCALRLCDDAEELGEIPTPCRVHLAQARTLARPPVIAIN